MGLYEGVIQSHINDDKMLYMDACIRKDIWHDGYGSVIFCHAYEKMIRWIIFE